jgi:hypothetical protein
MSWRIVTVINKDQIIEKIKKLLRMKRGGTPAEVETALALAAELARKHGINLGNVDPDQVKEQPIGHIDATTSARIQWECKYASLVCQEFFNVTAMLRQNWKVKLVNGWPRRASDYMITLIGTAWDTQIALYVYHFLVRHLRRCWNTRTNKRLRHRQSFLYGMYIGICTKLDEGQKQQVNEAGLVLVERGMVRRNDYMKATFGEIRDHGTTPDSDANGSKLAGYYAGLETEIRAGLTNKGTAAPLLN